MIQSEEGTPTVLVVDDAEANLDILTAALSQRYQVSVAMDGHSALEAVLQAPPDLILLDIMMPEMDGYEVCRRLKADQRFSSIPIIFLTALTEVENKTKGLEMGAVDYITKPFEIAEVRARVDTHLKLRQAQARLEHQNQMLKDYARLRDEVERITRHDLKTPLTAVINVPDMLMDEPNLTDGQRHLLRILQESGTRMLHLINRSLDLYKMEIGRYQLNPEPVEVVKLVRQIWSEMRELIHAKRLELILLVAGRPAQASDAVWVQGDEMLLYSLLANLIKNALEASPPQESITITLEKGGANQIIRIHNQGEVPEAIRGTFFDKFTTAGKKGGTGLGTYTARLIAQTLGGALAMDSSAQGGTLLTVSLPPAWLEAGREGPPPLELPGASDRAGGMQTLDPRHNPRDQAAVAAAPGQAGGVDVGILVVDDYPNMRRLIKSALRRMGYNNLFEAGNGQEALQILACEKIGLVISDVNMPVMNGVELLNAMRSQPATDKTPFIIITGEADKAGVLSAAKANIPAYLLKPFSPDHLKTKIEQVLSDSCSS